MAGEFDAAAFEELKKYVEELGLDEKQKNKFLLEEWRRMNEEKRAAKVAEEKRLEAEEKRLEAEERKLIREAEEKDLKLKLRRRLAREVEEKRLAREAEFEN